MRFPGFAGLVSADRRLAEAAHAALTEAARRPALYGPGRIPDTIDGRFEAAVLHAALALERLAQAPETGRAAQLLTDRFFRFLDSGLREAGVGDLSVPRKMKALAGAAYGRFGAYRAALKAGDGAGLAAALARNIWNEEAAGPFAGALAEGMLRAHGAFAAGPVEALGEPAAWTAGWS